jgi:poly(hydroxyalkanoate) depolymerase family esterase
VQQSSFTNAEGTRDYQFYIPSGYHGQAVPLLLMLHGCTQTPEDFALGTHMNTLAERETFVVVYPRQGRWEQLNRCWHWYSAAHQERDRGEPSLLAGLTQSVQQQYHIDPQRVYVAGLSAGAAMAVILGATYPDLYAAIGVSAGAEYKAAQSWFWVWPVTWYGGPDPEEQGRLAYRAAGAATRVVPVIVFHGTRDWQFAPVNAQQVISQWAQTNDLASDGGQDNDNMTDQAAAQQRGQVAGGYAYTHSVYKDDHGQVLMEQWRVEGMGHSWSGGDARGSYTDPKGPDASAEMVRFFLAHPRREPPT